jgi:hypothetical protein
VFHDPEGGSCVPELIAKSPLDVAPLTLADTTLTLADPGPITCVALFPGGAKAAGQGLKTLGLAFPEPGTWAAGKGGARIVWTGRDQAFVLGAAAPAMDGAAVTDQSDGWAALRLDGPGRCRAGAAGGAGPALGRLSGRGRRRSGLNHMPMVILRTEEVPSRSWCSARWPARLARAGRDAGASPPGRRRRPSRGGRKPAAGRAAEFCHWRPAGIGVYTLSEGDFQES